MGNVEKNRIISTFFQFRVNGPGHHISTGQIFLGIVFFHESMACGIHQNAAFPPDRFGNQKILGIRMIEAGGVKLNKFQIGNGGAGTVAHGDAVAGGNIGIAGVKIDFSGAAGCQKGDLGFKSMDLAGETVQNIGAATKSFMGCGHQSAFHSRGAGNQINGNMIFDDADAFVFPDMRNQNFFQFQSRHILGMNNPFLRMPPFTAQIKIQRSLISLLFLQIKPDPQVDEFANPIRPGFDHFFNDFAVAKTISGCKGVLDVKVKRIHFAENRSNSPLSLSGVAVHDAFFGYQNHFTKISRL